MTLRAVLAAAACLALPPAAEALTLSDSDLDALGRVVYAEAGGESLIGKVAVIETILNRLAAGRFGSSVQSLIEQPGAFEPVARAGGWRRLPPLTEGQRAELATILSLKASGHLGDVVPGALYFQNPAIVAGRAAAGQVPGSRVGFGGLPAAAVIGQHTFYRPGGVAAAPAAAPRPKALASSFVGEDLDAGMDAAGEGRGETVLVLPADGKVADVAAAP